MSNLEIIQKLAEAINYLVQGERNSARVCLCKVLERMP